MLYNVIEMSLGGGGGDYFEFINVNGSESKFIACVNPFKFEFTIVIFIHYKPRIAVAILDL